MKIIPLAGLLLAVLLVSQALTAGENPPAAKPEEPAKETELDQEALEAKFAKTLSGATLVGHFTANDAPAGELPQPDRYTIAKVTKLKGDLWLFKTRIQYGKNDITLPLPLRVCWAGDTPVITVDGVPVPGLGTFTARVLIYGDQYAGTWAGKEHGGHLFGKIEKEEDKPADTKEEKAGTPAPSK